MAALGIFKKDKKEPVKKEKAKKPAEAEVKEEAQEKETVSEATPKKGALISGDSQLVRPHITEKATELAAKNQYVFVVQSIASKREIGISVEKAYGVKVERVRIVNVHPKKMRLGKIKGVKKGYKKAIVQIKEGQTIEILPT